MINKITKRIELKRHDDNTISKMHKAGQVAEEEAQEKIQEVAEAYWEDKAAVECLLQKTAKWFDAEANKMHNKANQIQKAAKIANMQEQSKGIKKIGRAIDNKNAKPLTHIRRQGKAEQGYATDPKEIDRILRQAWGEVYKGNKENPKEASVRFMSKFCKYIYNGPQFEIAAITAEDVEFECKNCAHSAAGTDGFEPGEMAMLSRSAYQIIADLLNLVEEGESWPDGMNEERAVFMEKETDNVDDPLKFRVLKILPALYRRWAALRLRALDEWLQKWSTDDLYAGGEPIGTITATYGVGIMMEEIHLEGEECCGAAIDMAKYFDQVNRDLVYDLARAAGMPEKILQAYKRYPENLKVRNTIGKALGTPYRAKAGIPQGDPFSMLAAALIMRAWTAMMRAEGITPYVYVDDIMLVQRGQNIGNFTNALNKTLEYIQSMGAQISQKKSHMFATSPETEDRLSRVTWQVIKTKLNIVKKFRYLGAQVTSRRRQATEEMDKRMIKACNLLEKISKIGLNVQTRIKAITVKINPMAVYGAENANPSTANLQKFKTKILQCISGKSSRGDKDLKFATLDESKKDLDPEVQMIIHRVLAMRREAAKRPAIKNMINRIIEKYEVWQKVIDENSADAIGIGMKEKLEHGPVGILMQNLKSIGATLDGDFVVKMQNEQDLDLLETPFQALQYEIMQRAMRSRAIDAASKGTKRDDVFEIDRKVDRAAKTDIPKEERVILRKMQAMSEWTGEAIRRRLDHSHQEQCRLCNLEQYSKEHLIWRFNHPRIRS